MLKRAGLKHTAFAFGDFNPVKLFAFAKLQAAAQLNKLYMRQEFPFCPPILMSPALIVLPTDPTHCVSVALRTTKISFRHTVLTTIHYC